MRIVCGFVLLALLWALPVTVGHDGASAKIVCGQTDQGFKCRNESGAIRRGKMRKVPGSSSGASSENPMESGDADALPPASGDVRTSQQPAAATTNCPNNAELLGGHCIPYTQTCRTGLAANANPQPCQAAEEKQVCNFRPDGLKDCCCRTYSKF